MAAPLYIARASVERVDRALARHQEKCPTAASLRGAVEMRWSAEIEDEE